MQTHQPAPRISSYQTLPIWVNFGHMTLLIVWLPYTRVGLVECGHFLLFLAINVTEKNFCYMENRTHDLGTNRVAHRSRMLYHFPVFKSLASKGFI